MSATTAAGELLLLNRWLTLALQYHYTHDHLSAFLSTTSGSPRTLADFSPADFSPAFFVSLRTHMIRALRGEADSDTPDLAVLPEGLNNGRALRKLLMDDGFLLQHCSSMFRRDQALLWGDKEIGLSMLAEIVLPLADLGDHAPASALDRDASTIHKQAITSVRFALLANRSASEKDSPLRKKVSDLLAPSLRALRRTDSEGGLSISFLDTWLDKAEDWAQGLTASSSGTDLSETSVNTASTSEATVVQERMLEQIRTLQQSLKIFRDQVGDVPASGDASEVAASEEERVKIVQRKLRTEEGLRAFRKECADWVGAEVRSLLLGNPPHTSLFPTSASASALSSDASEEAAGEDFTATLESLLSPSPRQNLSLALARPEVYLAHFLTSAKADSPLPSSGVKTRVVEQLAPLVHGKRAQTDLSTAFNLLREAGGAGTGVKGRLIEVVDWFHAWCSLQQQQQTRSNGDETHRNGSSSTSTPSSRKRKSALETPGTTSTEQGTDASALSPSLQARFALALSSLALLGYIKKTAKRSARGGAGGALVLKVGGWDMIPGLTGRDGEEEWTRDGVEGEEGED
ncbi:hypothetical protein BCV69DRAFT_277843 [Microstroma glucosiphilum]|uniref:Origin recognition complex subunit 3 winged helix C-terminal domain-containing protein n=1 Tax=Pseudomicrostroma glucosiphilum TaxID=1684307 RepID=A0A316U444_9BASI|nr:hypothetical protein BCV69DRAFT_277843 [Pseudomicrostroma glucosiphilum]PWN20046.1 hypothetical protein BCV69DRAFT_277843 [Pseudomicrostroma glucosiphilum]